MGKQIKPDEFVEFSGIVTSGHPLLRPRRSSAKLEDFRVMPGNPNWIRLRGGRALAYNGGGIGSWGQFFQFNRSAAGGGVFHIARQFDATNHKWKNVNTASLPYTLADIETISTSFGFDSSTPSPIASVRESVFLDNGLGERNASTGSKPALSTWNGARIRYAGLDAYMPSGTPTVTYAEDPAGLSKLKYHRVIYFGLHNTGTNHFSNGVKIGKITPPLKFATENTAAITGSGSPQTVTVVTSSHIGVGDTIVIEAESVVVTAVPSATSVTGVFLSSHPIYTPMTVANGRLKFVTDDTKTPAGFYAKLTQAITLSANSQTVSVDSSARFRVGDQVRVGGMAVPQEFVTILAVPSATSFTAIFTANHTNGALVSLLDEDDASGNSRISSDFGLLDAESVGTISVAGLTNMKHVNHDVTEEGELKYVIYSTLDGGEVPYLVLLADGSGPLTVAIATSTVQLNLNAVDGTGHIVDVTQEMPRENFPPRPMQTMAYANGRLYGSLRAGGAGGATASENAGNGEPFSYVVSDRDLAAITFSAAADDVQDRDFVGVPEESWPLVNKKHTPNGEVPIVTAAINELDDVLVITKNGTFILRETADLLHEWSNVSVVDGILDPESFIQTIYGPMWVTQHRQVVILEPGSTTLRPLSEDYAALLKDITSATADYLRDPNHQIDRYQVWIGGGKSVCHDFYIQQREGFPAWTTTNQSVDVARTLVTASGKTHHVMAIGANLYVQEANPLTGVVAISDSTGPTTADEITGTWVSQWTDYGDTELRKNLAHVDILGDTHHSNQLNAQCLEVSFFADLDNEEFRISDPSVVPQGDIDLGATQLARFKVRDGNRRWYKYKLRLRGHSQEAGSLYFDFSGDGDLRPNYYGAIFRAMITISGIGENRP